MVLQAHTDMRIAMQRTSALKISCAKISPGYIWQYLLNELTDYGQGSADEALTNFTVGAANTTFYIVQPAVSYSCLIA